MDFTCEKSELFEVLGNVQSVIPGRSTHPVLSNVLIIVEGESIKVIGTDLDVTMEGKLTAKIRKEGAFAVPAKRVFELLRELAEGEVVVKREEERLSIVQGAGKFFVSGVAKEDYPYENMMKKEEIRFAIPVKEFRRMLALTSFAISVDTHRVALSGLLLKTKEKEITTVATDGHRLTLLKKKTEAPNIEDYEVLIPVRTITHLNKMLDTEEELVDIIVGEGNVRFCVGKYVLTSRLIKEKFPDYEQVIPKDNTKTLISSRNILVSATRRAAVLSNPLTHLLRFAISENKAELSSSDYDIGGEAYEEIPVEYSGDPITIGFNSSYLLEVLRHIESDEIKILMKNSLSAVLIVPLPQMEGEEYFSILMPLRLPEEEG